jgi:hypothetical protein
MEKAFGIAILVTLFFGFAKFLEMKYLEKTWKPLKVLIRDAFIVFFACFMGSFLVLEFQGSIQDFLNIVTETKTLNPASTQVFTDAPGF